MKTPNNNSPETPENVITLKDNVIEVQADRIEKLQLANSRFLDENAELREEIQRLKDEKATIRDNAHFLATRALETATTIKAILHAQIDGSYSHAERNTINKVIGGILFDHEKDTYSIINTIDRDRTDIPF